jgi:hypothetical protein
VPVALVVVALLLAVPTAWNYFRAPASSPEPSQYLAASPKGTEEPNTAAGPPSVEDQQRDIEERSILLDSKLGQLQANLILQNKKAQAERVGKAREKLQSALDELSNSKSGDK